MTLGVADRAQGDTQPSDVHGASILLPAASEYTFTLDVNLFTWDSYNENQGDGTGYWDSFSVTVTSEPYPYLTWTDPITAPFRFGGQLYGDGEPDTLTGTFTITVPGDPNGANYVNVVLDTFSQPDADTGYPSWGTVSIDLPIAGVESVTFVPATGDRAGTLSNDNPNGDGVTEPAFKGGFRFFPDAVIYDNTRNRARNIVRVRAVVANVPAGTPVYFRSFDVDDPSANAIIDPNDQRPGAQPVNTGKDNRGTVLGAQLAIPDLAPVDGSYRGRLAPAGTTNFEAEGEILRANTDAQGRAEVDLATSFNPGDNFRVVAHCGRPAVQALDDTTRVPTTGPIDGFRGMATPQLSVWRRFHVERDRMKAIPWGSRLTGNITGATDPDPTTKESVVTTNQTIPAADVEKYVGATLYDHRGFPNVIMKVEPGENAKLTVYVHQSKPENGVFTIYKGDAVEGKIKSVQNLQNGLFEVVVEPGVQALEDQFTGGLLRVAGRNYHIFYNYAAGATDVRIRILAAEAPGAVNDPVTVYDDDYSVTGDRLGTWVLARVTASTSPDANGDVELTINRNDIANARFVGGKVLHYGTVRVYDFVSVNDNKLKVKTTAALPINHNVVIWAAINNNTPTVLTDPTSDANMYDLLQATTARAGNRYADAYLQPVLTSLNAYSQTEVTPANHVAQQTNGGHDAVFDKHRGPNPRPTDPPYETDFFWAVYVSTAFEGHFRNANDGTLSGAEGRVIRGSTHGDGTESAVFLETIRDTVASTYALNQSHQIQEAMQRARSTVHEIGHQFLPPGHDDPPVNEINIMMTDTSIPTDNQFYFLPKHIDDMRKRFKSPPTR